MMKLLAEICCFAYFCVAGLYSYADYTQNDRLTRKLDQIYHGMAVHVYHVQAKASVKLQQQREKVDL